MGSLQDQLLKSGLVSEDQIKQAKNDSRKQRKRKPKASKSTRAKAGPSEAARAAQASKAANRSRDRELDRARSAERERRARLGQLRVLLDEQRKNDPEGEIKHFYQSGRKVKQLWVTQAQQRALMEGRLIIAVLEGRGHLLAKDQEPRLLKIDPDQQHIRIVHVDDAADDDAYAEHPIPDDLMW